MHIPSTYWVATCVGVCLYELCSGLSGVHGDMKQTDKGVRWRKGWRGWRRKRTGLCAIRADRKGSKKKTMRKWRQILPPDRHQKGLKKGNWWFYSTTRPLLPPTHPYAPCSPVLLVVLCPDKNQRQSHTNTQRSQTQTYVYAQRKAPQAALASSLWDVPILQRMCVCVCACSAQCLSTSQGKHSVPECHGPGPSHLHHK